MCFLSDTKSGIEYVGPKFEKFFLIEVMGVSYGITSTLPSLRLVAP